MSTFRLGALGVAPLLLSATAATWAAGADTDACTLLTSAQVGAAVGVQVPQGTHVTPTFVKTCTWTPSGASSVKSVTLQVQTAANYDGGKRMAQQVAPMGRGVAVQSASVGDDAYYYVAGEQVGLLVKKGGASFKVQIYATLPVDKKKAMEMTLARQVLAKL